MSGLTSFVLLYSLARGNNANAFLAGGTWSSDTFANPPLELWASFRTAGRDLGALGDLKLESVQRLDSLESFFWGKEEEWARISGERVVTWHSSSKLEVPATRFFRSSRDKPVSPLYE